MVPESRISARISGSSNVAEGGLMQIKKPSREARYSENSRYETPTFGVEAADTMADTQRPEPFASRTVQRPGAAQPADEQERPSDQLPRTESVIDRHSSFDGRFETEHDMRVEGTISGEIICRGLFTVDREATARAKVQARDAHIQGHLEGDVVCSGRLVLSSTAQVTGTLKAALLVIEEGATVSGTVDTTMQNTAPSRQASGNSKANAASTDDESREPVTVTRNSRRDLPSFAIVASDDSASGDRN
jgi:cytoskeletal protein CcmA (bactofilin family)